MARLVVTAGPDKGKEFALDRAREEALVAGRDARLPIAVSDSAVSREHFRIELSPLGYQLVDLGSRNRTFLNGEPVQRYRLRHGDVIAAGDSELRFEDENAAAPSAAATTLVRGVGAQEGAGITALIETLRQDPQLRSERLRRAVDGLRALFSLSREALRGGNADGLFVRLLDILVPSLEADRGAVLERAGGSWRPRAVRGVEAPPPAFAAAAEDEPTWGAAEEMPAVVASATILARAAQERSAVLAEDAAADERFRGGASIVRAGIASAMAAPILTPSTAANAGGEAQVAAVIYLDRRGASEPFDEDDLRLLAAAAERCGEALAHLQAQDELRSANLNLLRSLIDRVETRQLVGESPAMQKVHQFIRKAAPTGLTVLIRGETGTGKELVAQAIHYQSCRQGKPFVALNCAAIPESLIESELFGHEKGAFTHALARKKGRFELAESGTIFLDEIGELSLACQAKLLRLLEEKRFERVGGTQPLEVDVRIIAATNKDLAGAIGRGEFREDLYYRLNVLAVDLPALRERPADIPLLVGHFLAEHGFAETAEVLSAEALAKLQTHPWPGNVRQLRHAIESALVLGDGRTIRAEDLVLPAVPSGKGNAGWQPATIEDLVRAHILKVLEHTGGNKKRAAEILGIERCTLYARLKSYGVQSAEAEK